MPKISVIMPFYNCEKFLDASISSILHQTFSDFEFIIINDASYDNSENVVMKYISDPRILYIKNIHNKGIVHNLNHAITIARGEIIARMDGDDISDPMRFEKQLNFLSSYLEISIVGTFSNVIDTNGVFQYHMKKPIHDRDIKKNAFKFLTLSHNTSMFYRNIYNSVGPYRETYQYCEDQDFIYRVLLSGYKGANISEFLYSYRYHENSTNQYRTIVAKNIFLLRKETIKKFRLSCSLQEYLHIYGQFLFQYLFSGKIYTWFCYIYKRFVYR